MQFKLTPHKKIIFIITLFGALILSILLGIIYPTIKEIKNLNEETYSLRLYLEKRSQRATNIRSVIEKIPQIKADSITYSQCLFTPGKELELITTLENLATKYAITQNIRSSNLDQSATSFITLSLALSGNYHDTLRYLAELEGLPYFITIRRVQLAPHTDRSSNKNSAQIQTQLDITLYVNS